ncbi:hypothetical protein P280DRAFT_417944 [Massarina eburnea CBS 473.64]|uniref:Beta-glucuronidase C-terminal domain-containing protein n=1 Tax=Massarina eburnea CBS 473.64 TaxID=1395130 RepID=A0A6A6SHU1_9PLEO|nr:hypothetical protein P280DRAFT_417944 [Massarina eburnea CBS 473.64]
MASLRALLFTAAFLDIFSAPACAQTTTITPSNTPYTRPADYNPYSVPNVSAAGEAVLKSFVSYSIEFAFFPDFAGNKTHPNTFSNNLLNSLKTYQGNKPDIRVGGNTQDYALFSPTLSTAILGTYTNVSSDYPRILTIGPSYFDSYTTFPDTSFIHGFNLANNDSDSNATLSITSSIPYACAALSQGNLLYWEMGNEPDLFKTSAQGIMRLANWTEADYVSDWESRVGTVKSALEKGCGANWTSAEDFKWIAPSFAGTTNSINAVKAWEAGLGDGGGVAKFSSHNYIGGSTQPGITLANTLLNHTKTALSISAHTSEQASLKSAGMTLDYILGETNSLYNQGRPGLSNTFGAALWGLDFNLLCAATNIKQVFMHMGTDYRYASWQPIDTEKTVKGTKAPFYGNVAVAAALGDVGKGNVRVANIPMKNWTEAAYAVYTNETLERVVVINMNQYNYTGTGSSTLAGRPQQAYNFTVPTSCAGTGTVHRLLANGSDAITGITFDGLSFNYEVAEGKPSKLGNVTTGQVVYVGNDGGFAVDVVDSAAAIVQLTCLN